MHILISPNAFKHSLSAADAAAAIQQGLLESRLACTCECFAVGDGGDGTAELIIDSRKGDRYFAEVHDPLGRKIRASFGLIEDGTTAVIEMANASGLRLLSKEELDPLIANSYGTGEQIKQALDKGVKKIVIGMGGSATVDGGTGMLKALGCRFLNENQQELTDLPKDLIYLNDIDLEGLDKRIAEVEVVVLCDVDNLLLGENGSAAVFGPQKGASLEDVNYLDRCLQKLSEVIWHKKQKDITQVKYGGTAGGAAAGLYALVNAKLVNGIDYFLELTGFEDALCRAKLVITGEGSIDEQTLQGKGPFGVAEKAKMKNLPVIGLAGKVPLMPNVLLQEYFDVLLAIGNQPATLETALEDTTLNLKRTAREIGNLVAANFR